MIKKISWFKMSALITFFGFLLCSAYYFVHDHGSPTPAVVQTEGTYLDFYQPTRDRDDIINLFRRNLYWLTTNKDYSAEFMLDTLSPNEYDTRYFGQFHIKVMRIRENAHDAFIGFVGYYMKNFYEGTILFLAVHEDFRGKHYGEQLIFDAIKELRKHGASMITLLTWLHNKRSRALYERIGFVESSRDDKIIYYHYAK